jgi:hypothetical protein
MLAQRVAFDEALFVLGIFSDPERAKLAAAGHTGGEKELSWSTEEWEVGWQSYRATVLWSDQSEEIPLEFWIVPFLLDASEEGSQMIHGPAPAQHVH